MIGEELALRKFLCLLALAIVVVSCKTPASRVASKTANAELSGSQQEPPECALQRPLPLLTFGMYYKTRRTDGQDCDPHFKDFSELMNRTFHPGAVGYFDWEKYYHNIAAPAPNELTGKILNAVQQAGASAPGCPMMIVNLPCVDVPGNGKYYWMVPKKPRDLTALHVTAFEIQSLRCNSSYNEATLWYRDGRFLTPDEADQLFAPYFPAACDLDE